ncbi:hypothetical protein QR680_011418 [Steinernema hermaphroditum]|nr:hypothetical protein QR680_011418 [Steinernema hermaphroditum]
MAKQIQCILGLRRPFELNQEDYCKYLMSARIVNFLQPHYFGTKFPKIPLMPGDQTLRPIELKMLSVIHGFTRRADVFVVAREEALFEELLLVVRFFASHLASSFEEHQHF